MPTYGSQQSRKSAKRIEVIFAALRSRFDDFSCWQIFVSC
jgi:hypothetical protein